MTVTAYNALGNSSTQLNIIVLSNNPELLALSPGTGAFNIDFVPSLTNYNITVKGNISSIQFTPTGSTGQIIKINGIIATSGVLSAPVPLNPGDNNILVAVTAADGITTKTYTIKVKRVVNGPVISYAATTYSFHSGVTITPQTPVNTGGAIPNIPYGTTTTLTPQGVSGYADGPVSTAKFKDLGSITKDSQGNLYVFDYLRVRKISTDGIVSTVAGGEVSGFTNGTGTAATFTRGSGIAVDASGNIYMADVYNRAIRKITPVGLVTTFISNILLENSSIVIDAQNNIYVRITNGGIKKVSPLGVVTDFAAINSSCNLAIDRQGIIYTASGNTIVKISTQGVLKWIAGNTVTGTLDGTGTSAYFNNPASIAIDDKGDLYVTESSGRRVRKITPEGVVTTLAGAPSAFGFADGYGPNVRFFITGSIVADTENNIYVCDGGNYRIRKVLTSGYTIKPALPAGLSFDTANGTISGTPTTEWPAIDYSIGAYNGNGYDITTLNIAVTTVQPQTITFNALPAKTYGDADFAPGATSSNTTIPITYSSDNEAVATIINSKIHIVAAGTANITAAQASNNNYTAATSVSRVLTANKAPITVAATDQTKISGTPDPMLAYTINSGILFNADSFTGALTRDAGQSDGNYMIRQGSLALNSNYSLTFIPGTFTIIAPAAASAPTMQAFNLNFSNTTAASATVTWTSGNGAARAVFIARTANGSISPANNAYYSPNANFGNGSQLDATGWYCIYNGTGNSTIVSGLSPGTAYRVQVVEYNGPVNHEIYLSSPSSPANVTTPLAAPTLQALQVKFNNTTSTSTGISWTNGNGIARAVFIAKTANGGAAPSDYTYYSSNANFGNGKQIGANGWYCIYNGTGNSTTVTGLATGGTYRVHVVEYNGAINGEMYLASPASPANVTTPLAAPTLQALQVKFNNTTSSSTGISWTNGNGIARAVFIAKTANGGAGPSDYTYYSSNANFGNGRQIGATGWYCIYNGTGNSTTVTGLATGSTYRVHVVEYNGSINGEKYLANPASPANVTTPLAAPTSQALQVKFNNTTSSSTGISWTNGNGIARAVFIAKTANGGAAPSDYTYYSSNANFGNGKQIGATGWYCIYNGTGNSTTVTGLATGSTYRVHVVEYNGSINGERYLANPASPANVTTPLMAPTAQAIQVKFSNTTSTSTSISWTNGNGAARAVLIAKTNFGNTSLNNNTFYSPNPNFGNGRQVGTSGWYCIYNGTGNSTNVTGLAAANTYRVQVIEYNGVINNELYLNSPNSPANVSTLGASATLFGVSNATVGFVSGLSAKPASDADSKVIASNIISPNGDGQNDTWVIKNIGLYPDHVVTVYDAVGKTVLSRRNYVNDWDGSYHGSLLSEGAYNYEINLGAGIAVIRGFITIVRDR